MNIDLIVEVLKNNRVLWVEATIAGVFAIILSIYNAIMLFFQRKKQHDYDKKLESFKCGLESKTYISRAMFDKEFAIYQELMTLFYEAYYHFEVIHGMSSHKIKVIPRSEISLENPQFEDIADEVLSGKAVAQTQLDNEKKILVSKCLHIRKL